MVNPQDPTMIEPRTNELAYYQLVRLFPRAVPEDGPPTQELEDECGLDWVLAMALPCIRVAVLQAKEILDRRITPWGTDGWGSAMEVVPEADGTAAKAASGTHVPLPSGSSSSSILPPKAAAAGGPPKKVRVTAAAEPPGTQSKSGSPRPEPMVVAEAEPKGKAPQPSRLTPDQARWLRRWGRNPGLQRLEGKDIDRFITEEDTELLSKEVVEMYKGDLRAARYDMKHLATLVWEAMGDLSSKIP